jgi:hypothetical protein
MTAEVSSTTLSSGLLIVSAFKQEKSNSQFSRKNCQPLKIESLNTSD